MCLYKQASNVYCHFKKCRSHTANFALKTNRQRSEKTLNMQLISITSTELARTHSHTSTNDSIVFRLSLQCCEAACHVERPRNFRFYLISFRLHVSLLLSIVKVQCVVQINSKVRRNTIEIYKHKHRTSIPKFIFCSSIFVTLCVSSIYRQWSCVMLHVARIHLN